MNLNLSKMKKIATDGKSTTFQHPDGHEMRIAHSALSALQRKQIEKLPIHKYAEGTDSAGSDSPNAYPGLNEPQTKPQFSETTYPTGGAGLSMSDIYNQVNPHVQNQVSDQPVKEEPYDDGLPVPEFLKKSESKVPKLGESEPIPYAEKESDNQGTATDADAEKIKEFMKLSSAGGTEDNPDYQESETIPSRKNYVTPITNSEHDIARNIAQNDDNSGNGLPSQSKYVIPLDQKLAENQSDLNQQYRILHGANMRYENEVRSKTIDPNHFYAQQGTGQKIANAVGLLFSGVGSAMAHQPNLAYHALNEAINRDIDAQKNDQSQSMNLWKMHHEALKDGIAATLLTRSNMLTDAKIKMDEMIGNLPSPMAAQKVKLEQAKINDELNMINVKSAMLKQAGQPGQSNDGSPVNYNRLNVLQKTGLMPAADVSEATKEAEKVSETRAVRSYYNRTYQDLHNKFLAGALTPSDRASVIWTIAGKLQHATAGRFNLEDAKKQAEAMYPVGGDWDSTRVDKLKNGNELFDTLEAGTPTLDRYQLKNPIQKAAQAPVFQYKDGVKYQKVPGGWKKAQ